MAQMAFSAAISHFIADWPMHNNDLALYPFSVEHFGLGAWGKLGTASWVLQGIFSAALTAHASRAAAKARGAMGLGVCGDWWSCSSTFRPSSPR